jgi:hypothetical protein
MTVKTWLAAAITADQKIAAFAISAACGMKFNPAVDPQTL